LGFEELDRALKTGNNVARIPRKFSIDLFPIQGPFKGEDENPYHHSPFRNQNKESFKPQPGSHVNITYTNGDYT